MKSVILSPKKVIIEEEEKIILINKNNYYCPHFDGLCQSGRSTDGFGTSCYGNRLHGVCPSNIESSVNIFPILTSSPINKKQMNTLKEPILRCHYLEPGNDACIIKDTEGNRISCHTVRGMNLCPAHLPKYDTVTAFEPLA